MQTTLHNWGNTIRSLGSTDPSDDSDNEEGQADGTDSSDSSDISSGSSGSSKRGQPTVHDEEAQDDLQVWGRVGGADTGSACVCLRLHHSCAGRITQRHGCYPVHNLGCVLRKEALGLDLGHTRGYD